ncbi:hypothetical protein BKA70DRAFT_1408640 [Coprinopsis sp. MPI-PUGE-AT-0042]|nr:hypothetical protein BKA70DRAFT_1408640 [Coprinopsis sp. MPI-PUGE-AT-0042]
MSQSSNANANAPASPQFASGSTVNGGFFFMGGTHQNINTPQAHPISQNNTTCKLWSATNSASSSGATTPAADPTSATTPVSTPGTAAPGPWSEQGKCAGRKYSPSVVLFRALYASIWDLASRIFSFYEELGHSFGSSHLLVSNHRTATLKTCLNSAIVLFVCLRKICRGTANMLSLKPRRMYKYEQAPNPFVPGANFHGGIFYQYGGNNQNITTPQDHPVTQTNTTSRPPTPTSSASSSEPTTPATASSSTALAAGPAASPPVSTAAGTAPAGRWAEQGKRGGREAEA